MSGQPAEEVEWLVNRILIRGYLFWKYLRRRMPNDAVAVYSNYELYEAVRARLVAEGLIRVEFSGRGVESLVLTDNGVRRVENLLINMLERPLEDRSSFPEDPVAVFIKNLRLVRLLPTRIGFRDAEKLFKALVMLYPDGFFNRGPVPEFLNQMSDDIASGREVILRKMTDGFDIISKGDIDKDSKAKFIADVTAGREIVEKLAECAHIWRFYRFNPIALHTIVRVAVLSRLGSMGQKLNCCLIRSRNLYSFDVTRPHNAYD